MTKLRSTRMALGLKTHEVVRSADISHSMLSQLENARAKAGTKVRCRISGALGVSASELFDDAGWPIALEEVPV